MFIMGKERDYIIHNDLEVLGFFGDYRFLSNFEVTPVYFDGVLYPHTESAYHAAKSLDPEVRKQFVDITAAQSKKLGRQIEIRSDWEEVKYDVMASVVFDKFYRNLELRKKLLDTGTKYLEETNHWGDMYWGVCNGKGENNLGHILMKTRSFWKN